jgi:hypothetical protein
MEVLSEHTLSVTPSAVLAVSLEERTWLVPMCCGVLTIMNLREVLGASTFRLVLRGARVLMSFAISLLLCQVMW